MKKFFNFGFTSPPNRKIIVLAMALLLLFIYLTAAGEAQNTMSFIYDSVQNFVNTLIINIIADPNTWRD